MTQKFIFSENPAADLERVIAELAPTSVAVVADVNTAQYVVPLLTAASPAIKAANLITVKAGDLNKTLDAAQSIWRALAQMQADRRSVLVAVGGGMVTDLAGFAAATYMRGIRAVYVPTTLLAAVDASAGGKTGVNFLGLKNMVGTFTEPVAAIISSTFFSTLTPDEVLSGYGEMLKHALLSDAKMLGRLLAFTPAPQASAMLPLVEESVKVKCKFVEGDLREGSKRRALNLGHSAGHAFEELAMKRTAAIPHGFAVAHGCVVALVLSHMLLGFPSDTLHSFAQFVAQHYPLDFTLTCDDYPELLALMHHDKKNTSRQTFNFTLLAKVGKPQIDCHVSEDDVRNALDIYRDLIGI